MLLSCQQIRQVASLAVCLSALALLAACSAVSLVNALTPHTDYDAYPGLRYESGERHLLDVYEPKAPSGPSAGRPIVIFFYGGSWQEGERGDYRFVGEALASRGYVAVIPDYRLYPDVEFPAFMDDAAAAVSWARVHASAFGADPRRLFIMGHSAGAHIAMLLATDEHYLRLHGINTTNLAGAIGLAGPYDFLPLHDPTLEAIFPSTLRDTSQPIKHITGREPPIFLGVGTADRTVDPGNTMRLARRLTAVGDQFVLQRYPAVDHAMIVGSLARPVRALASFIAVAPVLNDISEFVDDHPGR
ncbi:alpha/beta hydrolase [Caballeronia sp. LZ029]|uniref:alpha/beta hydrolase n=1 Tax=Caballeronia sp. LZ029 TaxID=3038564 RepID=UPI0028601AB0|nr:alpha/beta hydrolase [Caballeronia sp. LZ029]MDR5748680.1 alpha/beta hydrolase [Caballeronia sp. LZ029]